MTKRVSNKKGTTHRKGVTPARSQEPRIFHPEFGWITPRMRKRASKLMRFVNRVNGIAGE